MIEVVRVPVRLTLGGGGTDLPSFYRRFGGHSIAMTVNRFVVVSISSPAGGRVEVRSAHGDRAKRVSALRDELTRASLFAVGITSDVQVAVAEDAPIGAGLGSSSAYAIGLIAAGSCLTGLRLSPEEIAERACRVEIDALGRAVGRQDQHICALGGLRSLRFDREGTVTTVDLSPDGGLARDLSQRLRLYWNGRTRQGHRVRAQQEAALARHDPSGCRYDELMQRILQLGEEALACLQKRDLDGWATTLHQHWKAKTALGTMNRSFPNELYEDLRANARVLGGKVMGAGGDGLVLLYCPDDSTRADNIMRVAGFDAIDYRPWGAGVEVLTRHGAARQDGDTGWQGMPGGLVGHVDA